MFVNSLHYKITDFSFYVSIIKGDLVLGIEPRTLHMLNLNSTTEFYPQPQYLLLEYFLGPVSKWSLRDVYKAKSRFAVF